MTRHVGRPALGSLLFTLAFAIAGCASMANPGDAGDGGDTGVDAMAYEVRYDTPFVCPADPSTLIGTACHDSNVTCGHCSDPCSFCNLVQCVSGTWSPVEVFPGPCDAGGTDVSTADVAPTPCGTTTCGAGEICVHTQAGGGPCRQPEDGGCGPGETLTGSCCVYSQEWYQCAPPPAACSGAITCGCAQSLCQVDGGPSCPCTTADATRVECGCFYP